MAKTIEQLTAAATLDGTELVELQQGDLSVQCTTQDIADLAGGGAGGPATVVAKTANFTADGDSGTIYTNTGASGAVVATLENSALGTEYKFIQTDESNVLSVIIPDGHDLLYVAFVSGTPSKTTGNGSWTIDTSAQGAYLSVVKVGATMWAGFVSSCTFND